ncbi:MAG: HAD family hydrolase, partial [Leptospiraceae bacterium]|nr:HAD family hydrolase [Leptospiraceae bacterium]
MIQVNKDPIPNNLDKPLLVLDLDETLIHSSDHRKYEKHSFKVLHFYVYERNYFREFIHKVFEKYSIGIWSAGSDYYVKLITERLIPESIEIDFIWARSRCSFKGHP